MSKRKGKIKLNSKKIKDLEGFEEVLDLVFEDGEISTGNNRERANDTQEVFDFLENETFRLKKLDDFISRKISTFVTYNQTQALHKRENDKRGVLMEELLEKVTKDNSIINQKLGDIYSSLFD